jgi:hypothetical protein
VHTESIATRTILPFFLGDIPPRGAIAVVVMYSVFRWLLLLVNGMKSEYACHDLCPFLPLGLELYAPMVLAMTMGIVNMDGMDNQTTNKEMALLLLQRLIDLEVEINVMAELLSRFWDKEKFQAFPWRQWVNEARETSEITDAIVSKYAQLKEQMQASTSECPDALSLLVSAAKGRG